MEVTHSSLRTCYLQHLATRAVARVDSGITDSLFGYPQHSPEVSHHDIPEYLFLDDDTLPLLLPPPHRAAESPDEERETVGEGLLLGGGGEVGEETQCQQQPTERIKMDDDLPL